MLINGTSALAFYSVILSDNSGVGYISIAFASIPFVLFDEKENIFAHISSSFTILTFFIVWSFNNLYQEPFAITLSEVSKEIVFILMTIVAFIFSIGSVFFFKKSSTKFESDLQDTNLQLQDTITKLTQETQEKEAALVREHEKAIKIEEQSQKIALDAVALKEKQIQENLLKQAGNYQQILYQDTFPQPEKQRISAFGSASHYISGDYRYVSPLGDFVSASLVLDVTGHGAPAAMMTGILSKNVDDLFSSWDDPTLMEPSTTMRILNKILCDESRLSKFMAGVYLVADTENYLVHASCAGAEAPMIFRNGKIIPLSTCNDSLRMDNDSVFSSITAPILPGDIIIICSDGLMDRELKNGEKLFDTFECQNLQKENAPLELKLNYSEFETILKSWNKELPIAEFLGEELEKLCIPANDDMTIVCVEIF